MKEIKAIVREEKAQEVLDALEASGARNVTISKVLAVGVDLESVKEKLNIEYGRPVARMVQLKIICSDRDDLELVKVIRKTACTGSRGDGIITVANINRLLKIRSVCQGLDAL